MNAFDSKDFYSKLRKHFDLSDRGLIESFLRDSFSLAKTSLDEKAIILVGNEYASYLRFIGDTKVSYEIYEFISSKIIRMFGLKSKEYASFLLNLGDVDIVEKDYRKAFSRFNEAEQILRDFDKEIYLKATLYNNRSQAYKGISDNRLAIKDIKLALELMKDNDSKTAISLINLSEIYISEGEFLKAKKSILESIKMFKKEELKKDIHYANALSTAGQVFYYLGDYDKSLAYLTCSLEQLKKKAGESKVTDIIKANIDKVKRLNDR